MSNLNVAVQRLNAQKAAAATPPANASALPPVAQAQVGAPGLVRVSLPPREEERVKPRKAAAPMQPPREQAGGSGPLASPSLADGRASALLVQPKKHDAGAVGAGMSENPVLTAEQEADADFAAGRYTTFERDDQFVAALEA